MKTIFLYVGICSFGFINLCSAADSTGLTATEIVIGAHTIESGPLAVFSSTPKTMSAYFEKINAEGGVNGRKIKFIRIDTQSDLQKSLQATKKLVEEDKIFAMVMGQGLAHQAVYRYLVEKKVPDLFFNDGIAEYGSPVKKTVFPLVPSFEEEGKLFGSLAAKRHPGKKACFLLTDNALGEDFLRGAKSELDAAKMKIGKIERADRTAAQANTQILNLKKDGCDIVITSTYSNLFASAVTYSVSQGFKPAWFTISYNANSSTIPLLPESAREGIISSTAVAPDEGFKVAQFAAFKDLLDKNKIGMGRSAAIGYASAEFFVEAVKRSGKDLSREKIVEVTAAMNGWTCSICLSPAKVSEKDHYILKPDPIITKNGKWTLLN